MIKTLSFLSTAALSTEAFAHAGHVAEEAGHAHWAETAVVVALATIAVSLIVRVTRTSKA